MAGAGQGAGARRRHHLPRGGPRRVEFGRSSRSRRRIVDGSWSERGRAAAIGVAGASSRRAGAAQVSAGGRAGYGSPVSDRSPSAPPDPRPLDAPPSDTATPEVRVPPPADPSSRAAAGPPQGAAPAGRRAVWRRELHDTLRLALPVTTVQVGLMAMGVVDTMMVGHLSAAALAAVALGSLYFYGVSALGQGMVMALDPLVAQAVGARDRPAVARAVQRGLVLAALLAVPLSLALLPAGPLLAGLGQPPDVVPDAAAYARASIPGLLPYLAFVVLRQTLQAMHHVRAIVLAIVVANVANVGFNWVLIYGHLGFPALGPVGSAWASTLCRWLMALLVAFGAWRHLRPVLRPWRRDTLRPRALAPLVRLGLPIAAQQGLEFGAFGTIGLLMGRLGTVAMAGHQAALNLASLTFMVPLGVGAAAAVRVGHATGRGDLPGARRAAGAAVACGVGFMAASAVVLLAVPGALARLYTTDGRVLALAAALIPVAGVFQVFDGLQVVSLGILRGAADTRTPMLVNAFGFWVLGIPLGAWLGLRTTAGPVGLWWGLVVGLAVVGLVLAARVRWRLGRATGRVGEGAEV